MSVGKDDHKRARFQGEAFMRSYLATTVQGGVPVELVESMAAGIASGMVAFVATYVSEKAAYEMLQAAADRAAGVLTRADEAR